jgi:hypothetical protein
VVEWAYQPLSCDLIGFSTRIMPQVAVGSSVRNNYPKLSSGG